MCHHPHSVAVSVNVIEGRLQKREITIRRKIKKRVMRESTFNDGVFILWHLDHPLTAASLLIFISYIIGIQKKRGSRNLFPFNRIQIKEKKERSRDEWSGDEQDQREKKNEIKGKTGEEWGEEMKGGVGGGGGSSYTFHPKRRWRGFVVAVLGLVILSMLVPLIFLLGLHNGFHSAGISLTCIFPNLTFLSSDLFIRFSQFSHSRFYSLDFRWILCQIWIFHCHCFWPLEILNYGLFQFAFGFWVSQTFFFFFFSFSNFFFKVLAYLGEGVWFCCEVIILGFLIFDILILMLFPILKVKSLKQFTSNCCAGYVAEPRNAVPVRIWRHLWIQWHSLAFDFIVLILMNMYISSLNGKQRSFDHYGNTRTWNQSEVMLPYNWGIGLSMPYSLAIFGTICFIALNLCMIIKLSFIFYFLFQNDH